MMEYKKITQEELNEIIRKHNLFLLNEEGGERAILDWCDLSGLNLSGVDLTGASFYSSILNEADLSYSVLEDTLLINASLCETNLYNAILSKAIIRGAYLINANLRGTNLSQAILSYSDLTGSDLSEANLYRAKLDSTMLSLVNLDNIIYEGTDFSYSTICSAENIPNIPMRCPEKGSFIGYKKALTVVRGQTCIVELKILEDAKRSSGVGKKCRCDKAEVLSISLLDGTPIDVACSWYDSDFIYKVGEIVEEPNFNNYRWKTCAKGIHFFMKKEEAINYDFR